MIIMYTILGWVGMIAGLVTNNPHMFTYGLLFLILAKLEGLDKRYRQYPLKKG